MKNIGLVLCGGGAKGAYQVGVFKVLEELEIANEIKMISGSSIGALNGALYLMYSADEIDQIWQQCNWTAIFGVSKENIKKVNQIVHRVNTRQMWLELLIKQDFHYKERDLRKYYASI